MNVFPFVGSHHAVDTFKIGENIFFEDPYLQMFKRTADHVFNFLYFFVGCDPEHFRQFSAIREAMLKKIAKKSKRELQELAYEITIFIEALKKDFYNLSVARPMIYIEDFFLNFNNYNHFYVMFRLNKTSYMYTSTIKMFLRMNNE